MKYGMHVFMVFFCTISITYSQNIYDNIELSLGYALKNQDRRLFEFPNQFAILYNEDSHIDFEYSLILNKIFFPDRRINFSSGLGYSLSQSSFGRPFDHNYFTHSNTLELRYIEMYLQHNLNLNINPKIKLLRGKNSVFYVNNNSFVMFLLNKDIKSTFGGWHHNKWKIEMNAIESYLGLGFNYRRIGINLAYRVFNIQKIDPVIFNQILFNTPKPDFLEQNYEIRNDNKIWFIVSYQIR